MVWIKGKILDRGRIVQEQLVRVLQRHEDAINQGGGSVSIDDLTDAEVVEAVITYEDESTATVLIVTQASNEDTTQQELGE